MIIKEVPTAQGYDLWAQVYEKDGNPMMAIDEDVVYNVINNNIKAKKVIDLGCGTGRHSIKLISLGAEVTAVDFSKGMLEIAMAKPGAERIKFLVNNLEEPLNIKDNLFDVVLSSLVLEHILKLDVFFNEVKRILKQDGFALITAMHPAMMLKGTQANFVDPASGEKIFPKGYPNQLSDFVNAITRANLKIINMEEHFGTDKLAKEFPRAQKYINWPMLVSFKLVKE